MREPRWRRLRLVLRRLATRVVADDVATHAAAMTYATFLAIPPLLFLGLSVTGFVLAGNDDARRSLAHDLVSAIPGLHDVLGDWLGSVVDGRATLGFLALPALLWTATGAFARVRHALGAVFDHRDHGLLVGRLHGLLVQVPLGLGLVALVTANSVVAGLGHSERIDTGAEAAALLLLWVVDAAYFAVVYRLLAPGVPLRDHVPGAVLFALAWGVLHRLGAAVVPDRFGSGAALYGSIGVVFGLLAFLYATSWVFLTCAELSQVLREDRGPTPGPPGRGTAASPPSPGRAG